MLDLSGATSRGSEWAYAARDLPTELGDPCRDLVATQVDVADRLPLAAETLRSAQRSHEAILSR